MNFRLLFVVAVSTCNFQFSISCDLPPRYASPQDLEDVLCSARAGKSDLADLDAKGGSIKGSKTDVAWASGTRGGLGRNQIMTMQRFMDHGCFVDDLDHGLQIIES